MNPQQNDRSPRRQNGAAVLAMMLVFVVAASFILVTKLNSNVGQYTRQGASAEVLSEAKAALISYALRYPEDVNPDEGPGYLPCPDISNNGQAGTSCSLGGPTNTTIGRLPFKTLEISDLRDHEGERLWYAVSDNFKNNPKVLASLNTDSPGTLTLNGNSDIVAVIFAPGAPVGNQDRSDDPLDAANYLEDANADDDVDFVSRATATFNDQVIAITRQELMSVVEKRVMGDVKQALASWRTAHNAYPWLTPFADPKADFRSLQGNHSPSGGNNSVNLVDAGTDVNFTEWGVQVGDTVINMTNGSMASVIDPPPTSSTLTLSWFTSGSENDFDIDDEYIVIIRSNPGLLSGTTGAGSNNLVLADASKNFAGIGVSPGDIVDLDDGSGSSGVIETVSATSLTVTGLDGGSTTSFSPGLPYHIRSNRGTHTGSNNSANLTDSTVDYNIMGVQPGDRVVNLTDRSIGRVTAVTTNTLTLSGLYFGMDNDFDSNDPVTGLPDTYYIPKFNTNNAAREGLLSFHEPGEVFRTAFSIDWSALVANGSNMNTTMTVNDPHTTYLNDQQSKAQTSSGTSGTINIDYDDGQCIWAGMSVAECTGIYDDPNFPVQGTVTSGFNTSVLTDSNADFIYTAVKRGDIVRNYDDEIFTGESGTTDSGSSGEILEDTGKNFNSLGIIPYYHFIHNHDDNNARGLITEIIDNNTIRVVEFSGRPAINVDPGEGYSIYEPEQIVVTGVDSATQLTTSYLTSADPDLDAGGAGAGGAFPEFYQINIATGLTPTGKSDINHETCLWDDGADFSYIEPGDVVENLTDDAFGIIWFVDASIDVLCVNELYVSNGSERDFNVGEDYRIYYNHDVNQRRYELQARYSGNNNSYSASEVRKRDVCAGYNSDCSTASSNVSLPQQNSFVVIRDLDVYGNTVATTSISTPAGAQGTIRISGMDYYINAAANELPTWFFKNKWYQHIYLAYSSGFTPGGSGNCVTGTDCLSIGGAYNITDNEALVLSAGVQLEDVACETDNDQFRIKGRLCDYFEDENQTAIDDAFSKNSSSGTFNDKLLVVSPPLF